MKKYIVTILFLSSLATSANAVTGCGLLYFFLPPAYRADVMTCARGEIEREEGYFVMSEEDSYGPDCIFKVFPFNNPEKFTVLRTQQNYCALEAGAIHVEQITATPPSLKAQYTTHEGAYFTGFSGDVTFKGFNE
ncbi:hypothetical protein [Bathymodiolus heckerae thiotrophic gill symbiont]|uniref:hypothetical protein n=1 Tax=Bathymodiolus heckerae thiotrophic gill symbiont TaxID=1052212 RepID=UPI0010FE4EC9|nr:hypothetical protein [Bathymodiolus heckerae thiotrophic gill symbiont]